MKQLPLEGLRPASITRQRIPVLCDPKFQRHSPTSEAAAVSIAPHAGTLEAKIFAYLSGFPAGEGATDEEMQFRIPMNANSQRPRRVALVNAGLVKDSGRTRPTISGNQAAVWVVVGE